TGNAPPPPPPPSLGFGAVATSRRRASTTAAHYPAGNSISALMSSSAISGISTARWDRRSFFFSSRRRHTRSTRDWSSDGALPIWAEQFELPVPPELAELLLARRRRPVAAAGRCPAGIAARDRGAVERRIERILVQLEPAAERPA